MANERYHEITDKLNETTALVPQVKLRDYQQKVMDQLRNSPDTVMMEWPKLGLTRSGLKDPRTSYVINEKLEHFKKMLKDAQKHIDSRTPMIVLDSYAALDVEASHDLYRRRIVDESRVPTWAGKTTALEGQMAHLRMTNAYWGSGSRNHASRRHLPNLQLNDVLPPMTRMRRAVQSAVNHWSSK